ncbi:hypothetical protein [Paenibacillus selenitireducens]|uniref:hypothetical protein n=1 Tax=Paenibacillus selenitireducens TaxID=1324314 RepID=UPI001301AA55|nr:hypothetical protein [Paenibacillus selenitireducens]
MKKISVWLVTIVFLLILCCSDLSTTIPKKYPFTEAVKQGDIIYFKLLFGYGR